MSEHEKTTAEVLDWDCVYGECEHVDDCPTRVIEVCAGCTVVYEPDEIDALLPWAEAEARGHAPEPEGQVAVHVQDTEMSTTNSSASVCAPSATGDRGYCGRQPARVSRSSLDEVTCADCIAALVVDVEHHESGGSGT